jgi:DNA-binding transcriptional LysR family regulator
MDVRFLVTFLEVAETRHFGKAAENLYLTQSAVSARIKQLEEYFNSALFIRNRNSLQLTNAGEKLVPFAESLASTLRQARESLSDDNIQQLTLAATPNGWGCFLKQRLPDIQRTFSDVVIKADLCTNEQLVRAVHEHAIDFAIATQPFKSDDVKTIQLCQSPLALYASPQLSDDELKQVFIYLEWGKKYNELVDKALPFAKHAKLRTSALNIVFEHLAQQPGSVVLPVDLCQREIAQFGLEQRQTLTGLSLTCYAMYLKETSNSSMKDVIDFLTAKTEQGA